MTVGHHIATLAELEPWIEGSRGENWLLRWGGAWVDSLEFGKSVWRLIFGLHGYAGRLRQDGELQFSSVNNMLNPVTPITQ